MHLGKQHIAQNSASPSAAHAALLEPAQAFMGPQAEFYLGGPSVPI